MVNNEGTDSLHVNESSHLNFETTASYSQSRFKLVMSRPSHDVTSSCFQKKVILLRIVYVYYTPQLDDDYDDG